ncbi:L-lactate permease [Thermomonospora amylolytica]|uniref:L-lactate permease n=1 Tax=Thermomonospora amylolytica TaxID=1411117 RepID=UPI000E6D3F59|nr:L-lactate permease [Thermomonospora amylolytica]
MYRPDLSPLADSLGLSALVALLPLIAIFVLLGVLRVRAHVAALVSVAVAVAVAVIAYGMPPGLALLAASEGAAFGLFPIMWIVLAAVWVYRLTVASGRFDDLRRSFQLISDDHRVQAIVIAFCFGGLLEALAGFGAPVAITGVMLTGLGLPPVRAAVAVLVANTAPVAYGAIATPIITAGALTGIPYEEIGARVALQTPVLALFVPLVLAFLVDGRRGLRQTWPAALVCGIAFAIGQFTAATFVSVELTDIIASLVALAATVLFLRFWKPSGDAGAAAGTYEGDRDGPVPPANGGTATRTLPAAGPRLNTGRVVMALLPYLIIIGVFALAKLWTPLKEALLAQDVLIEWPGLHGQVLTAAGKVSSATVYTLSWLSSPGTLLLMAGVVVAACYRLSPATAAREFAGVLVQLRWAFLTVASVLALAYVMNLSGQTVTVGAWIAGTGAAFAFLSPILGWLGTAVTGSDTSANALFATMQQTAATKAGLDPTLLVAANTSGGVVGKMISPQNLTIAVTAVGLDGQEGRLFRMTIRWSLLFLLGLCLLTLAQSLV